MPGYANAAPGMSWILHNWQRLTDLPAPGETWLSRDVGLDDSLIRKLSSEGAIKSVGRSDGDDSIGTNVWETDPSSYAFIKELEGNYSGPTMPCCSAPWHIKRDETGFVCKYCASSVTRAELQAERPTTTQEAEA